LVRTIFHSDLRCRTGGGLNRLRDLTALQGSGGLIRSGLRTGPCRRSLRLTAGSRLRADATSRSGAGDRSRSSPDSSRLRS